MSFNNSFPHACPRNVVLVYGIISPGAESSSFWKKRSLLIMMHVDAVLVYFGQGSAYWSIMHPF